jgi:TonB-linked SusC/RagA family outer membrane protein
MKSSKHLKCVLLIAFIFACSVTNAVAQQHTVSGTVTDAQTNQPLPGVNILVVGTTTGAATDANGHYELTVKSLQDTLRFSFIGYKTMMVPIDGHTKVNIALKPQIFSGKQLVVVAFGKQKKANISGSVSTVDMNQIAHTSNTSIAGALEGKVSGVHVQTSGAPGEAPKVYIRGIGTFGNKGPLYVVNGIQVPNIIDFDPQLFNSVSVLKDASSAAVYGSRAANGVILVQTKHGSHSNQGKINVSLKSMFGTENVFQRIPVLGRKHYQEMTRLALKNAGLALTHAKASDPNSPLFIDNINTDWQDRAYKRGYSNHQVLNITGGSDNYTFDFGGSYQNETSTFNGPAPAYKAVSAMLNSSYTKGRFTVGENIWLTRSIRTPQTSIINNGVSQVGETLHSLPIVSVRDSTHLGGFGGPRAGVEQGIALNTIGVDHLMDRKQYVDRALVNLWGKVNITKDLAYKLNLAYDKRNFNEKWFVPPFNLGFFFFQIKGKLQVRRINQIQSTMIQTLHYNHQFNVNNGIKFLAGYSEEPDIRKNLFASGTGFTKPYREFLSAAKNSLSQSKKSEDRLRSYFGRLRYNYSNRYLLSVSFRRDGSSRFAKGNKWSNFPAASVAWRIGNEKFMNNIPWLSGLKLRASWGKVGNQRIGDYSTEAFININPDYGFNDQLVHGAAQESLVNHDLRWEVLTTRTIALNLKLFQNKLNFKVAYFNNDANHILVGVPIPGSLGSALNPEKNAASINNRGFEVTAAYRNTFGELNFSINTDVTALHNEVTSLGGVNAQPIFGAVSKTDVGHPIGAFYGYIAEGIFQNKKQIKNSATQEPGTAPGDIRFKDLNGDGVINAADRIYIGDPAPDFRYGLGIHFGYHRFDASFFFNGTYGNKIYNNQLELLNNMSDYNNTTVAEYKHHWTPTNHQNNPRFPRPVIGDPNANNRVSTRYVENGTYLRLKNLNFGYTIPINDISRGKIKKLRVFMTVDNVFTVTGYRGLDPDIGTAGGVSANSASSTNIYNNGLFNRGVDASAWPHPRAYRFGINIKF